MSNTTTATVETLTAEVRVLMVGSRQVTLSVARQLDYVALAELQVFGRVKLGGSAPDNAVIGRDANGNLALSTVDHYRKSPNWRAWIDSDPDLPESELPEIGWCVHVTRDGECPVRFTDPDIPVTLARGAFRVRSIQGWQSAHNNWVHARNEWWKEHGTEEGFSVPAPKQEDFGSEGWTPGVHKGALLADALGQYQEAIERHNLYEAAMAAPLIVLAGLR